MWQPRSGRDPPRTRRVVHGHDRARGHRGRRGLALPPLGALHAQPTSLGSRITLHASAGQAPSANPPLLPFSHLRSRDFSQCSSSSVFVFGPSSNIPRHPRLTFAFCPVVFLLLVRYSAPPSLYLSSGPCCPRPRSSCTHSSILTPPLYTRNRPVSLFVTLNAHVQSRPALSLTPSPSHTHTHTDMHLILYYTYGSGCVSHVLPSAFTIS